MENEHMSSPFMERLIEIEKKLDGFIENVKSDSQNQETNEAVLHCASELQERIASIFSTSSAINLLASLAMRMHGDALHGDGRKQSVKEARHFLPEVMKALELIGIELIGVDSEEFDLKTHCVVNVTPSDEEHPQGSIAHFERFGIRLKGEVFSPAYVVIHSDQKTTEENHENDSETAV